MQEVCAQDPSEETGSRLTAEAEGAGSAVRVPPTPTGRGPPGVRQARAQAQAHHPARLGLQEPGVRPVVPGGPPPHTLGLVPPWFPLPSTERPCTGPAGTGGWAWSHRVTVPVLVASAASTPSPAPGKVLL